MVSSSYLGLFLRLLQLILKMCSWDSSKLHLKMPVEKFQSMSHHCRLVFINVNTYQFKNATFTWFFLLSRKSHANRCPQKRSISIMIKWKKCEIFETLWNCSLCTRHTNKTSRQLIINVAIMTTFHKNVTSHTCVQIHDDHLIFPRSLKWKWNH